MRTLALMEQGLTLGVTGDLYSVERGGKLLEQIRMADIDEVLVFGAISVTPAALAAILRQGADAVFLTSRGRYLGRLVGRGSKNAELRLAQFDRVRDPAFALEAARGIVAGKIANQRSLLLRAQREQKREDLAAAIAEMRRLAELVAISPDRDSLRGLEGQAAAVYFGVFGLCVRNPLFAFEKRSRRPPRDPVNALLSFGYTFLGTAMESLVLRAGLDPMLGVFHGAEYGRPSLMLDLIEEFRPLVVDSLALRLVNLRAVAPEDFEEPPADDDVVWSDESDSVPGPEAAKAVWLGESGRRVFFRSWGRRLRETVYYEPRRQTLALEEIMRQQVYHFARVVKGEEPAYAAFTPR